MTVVGNSNLTLYLLYASERILKLFPGSLKSKVTKKRNW